jgi:hypothetical protein
MQISIIDPFAHLTSAQKVDKKLLLKVSVTKDKIKCQHLKDQGPNLRLTHEQSIFFVFQYFF